MRQVVLFLHLAAAMFWIGEILFLTFVVGPYAQRLPLERRSELYRALGRRSLPFAWGAIVLLIVTGILNLVLMGIPLASLGSPTFYGTPFGTMLLGKLIAVVLMLAVSVTHDFVLSSRRRRLAASGLGETEKAQMLAQANRLARTLGIVNFVLALVVLFFAAGLVVQG